MFRRSAAQAPGSAVSLRTTGKQREEHAEDEERDGNKNEQSKKQKKGKEQKKKSMKGIYRATEALRPPPFATSDDPNHPNMRTYFQDGWQHTGNLMPENAFYKDHDSEVLNFLLARQDEPDPWIEFDRVANMDSKEFEQEIWDNLEKGYEILHPPPTCSSSSLLAAEVWTSRGGSTRKSTTRQSTSTACKTSASSSISAQGCGSSSPRPRTRRRRWTRREDEPPLPTTDEPFCMKCGSLLGYSDPGLGLKEDVGAEKGEGAAGADLLLSSRTRSAAGAGTETQLGPTVAC
eukprot:751672-Hanusia_phi.AAC.1